VFGVESTQYTVQSTNPDLKTMFNYLSIKDLSGNVPALIAVILLVLLVLTAVLGPYVVSTTRLPWTFTA
jgi:hypothetical protein